MKTISACCAAVAPMTEPVQPACPACGAKGRKIERRTPESLLIPAAKQRLEGNAQFRFCKNGACDVVYFAGASQSPFTAADLSVLVYQKSKDPARLVCYCFAHSVQSINDEVAREGGSNVAERIGEKCKAGLDDCQKNNPQGACCLGNVRQVVKTAMADHKIVAAEDAEQRERAGCCAASVEPSSHGT